MVAPLNPELEQFVANEIASGRFPDREAVVAFALRLMQRDREDAVAGIRAGLSDAEAGRVQPLAETFAELRRDLGLAADA